MDLMRWGETTWKPETRIGIVWSDSAAIRLASATGTARNAASLKEINISLKELVAKVQHAAVRGARIDELQALLSGHILAQAIQVTDDRAVFIAMLKGFSDQGDWMWDGGRIGPDIVSVRLWSGRGG